MLAPTPMAGGPCSENVIDSCGKTKYKEPLERIDYVSHGDEAAVMGVGGERFEEL